MGKKGCPFSERLQFLHKNKLKSEISNMIFSVITNNLNWEIFTKYLTTFERWDGVKDEKF